MRLKLIRSMAVIAVVAACLQQGSAQHIRRTFAVLLAEPEPCTLTRTGRSPDQYARDGQVTVSAVATGNSDAIPEATALADQYRVETTNNHVEVAMAQDRVRAETDLSH